MKKLILALLLLWPSLAFGQANTVNTTPLCSTVVCAPIDQVGLDFSTNNPLFIASGGFTTLTAPLGLSYWVKVQSSFAPGFADFISNRGITANQTGFEAYWRTNTDIFNLKFGALPNGTVNCAQSGLLCARNTLITIPPNTWKHVCVAYSTTVDTMYVNGLQVDQRLTGSAFSPNTSYVKVGDEAHNPFALRDIRIRQGTGFTQFDCQQLYSAGIGGQMPTTGPLAQLYAWWPMNDCSGGPPVTLCPDHSGHSPARDLIADAAPVVTILTPSPSPPSVSGSSVSLTATCTDLIGCNSVSWSVDGSSVGSSSTAPYTVTWNSATVTDRAHVITANASNAGGSTGTANVTVTTANSLAGINWYFSPIGVHGNTCQSPAQACPITDQFAAPGARDYLEDDTINFDAGNGPFIITTSRIFLNTSSGGNANPGSTGHPIIIQSYGGSGSCIPLAGQLGQCAKLQLDPASTLEQMTLFSGLSGIVERNLQLIGGTATAFVGTGGTASGMQWFNNLNGATFTFTNNLSQDWSYDSYVHSFSGTLVVTETNNLLTGTSVNSVGNLGAYMEGHNISPSVFQSNVCSNIGSPLVNTDPSGQGSCFVHNRQLSITPNQSVTIQDNASHDMAANSNSCGGPFHYWGVNFGYLLFRFDEGWNMVGIGGCDQGLWDNDLSTSHTISQYGYAHHNWGECMLFFNGTQDAGVPWNNNTMSYNICETSVNPSGLLGATGAAMAFAQTGSGTFAYGSTIYSAQANVIHAGGLCLNSAANGAVQDFTWANNVCVRLNAGPSFVLYGFGTDSLQPVAPGLVQITNDYYSVGGGTNYFLYNTVSPAGQTLAQFQASNPGKEAGSISTNPLLTAPGGNVQCYSGSGVPAGPQPCPNGYQLTGPTSPVIGMGTNPASFGATGLQIATQDYFLNAIPNGVGSGWSMGADGAHH